MTKVRMSTSISSTRSAGTQTMMDPHTPDRNAKSKSPPSVPSLPRFTFLNLGNLPQSSQGGSHSGGSGGGNDVGAASDGALAGLAVPDAGGVAADGGLAAEGAGVLGVLRNLHLLDLLTQGGTVASTVLAGHADLLRALGHLG